MKKSEILKEIKSWENDIKYYHKGKNKSKPYRMLYELHLKLETINSIENVK